MSTEVQAVAKPFTEEEIRFYECKPIREFDSTRKGKMWWRAIIERAEACQKLEAMFARDMGDRAINTITRRFCEALVASMTYDDLATEAGLAAYNKRCEMHVAAILELYVKFKSAEFFMFTAEEVRETMKKIAHPMP